MTAKLPVRLRECEICHQIFQIKSIRGKYCSRCKSAYGTAWAKAHLGYMAKARKRYLTNPIHKERMQIYQKEYRERITSKERANFLRNEKYKHNTEYREKRKAYTRAHHYLYRVNHTREQWEALKRIYSSRCAYCGRKMKRLTKDHLIPISQGNPENVDRIENILPSCQSCNSKKHTNTPSSFQMILATDIIMPT